MTSFTDYIDYFEGLAAKFLKHTSAYKTFYRAGLDEYLNQLRDVHFPCMLLDTYDFVYEDNGGDSVQKNRTISMIITDHVSDINDYDLIDTAFDNCEQVIDFIFNQIRIDRTDPEANAFIQAARLNNIKAIPVYNYSEGNYGFLVTIDINSYHNYSKLS